MIFRAHRAPVPRSWLVCISSELTHEMQNSKNMARLLARTGSAAVARRIVPK
jgi:hypothetical protein